MGGHARKQRRRRALGEDRPGKQSALLDPGRSLLSLQAAAGNRAVAGVVQRQGSAHEPSQDVMLASFNAIFDNLMAVRGNPTNEAVINQTYKDALAKFEKRIGQKNYRRFLASGVPTSVPSQAEAEELERQEAEAAQASTPDLATLAEARVRQLRASAQALSSEVAQLEYLAHKLKSPEGIKGIPYEYTGGIIGAASTLGIGAHDVAEDVVKPISDPASYVAGKGIDKAVGKKPTPSLEEKWEQFKQGLSTSDELMKGELHKIWKATRPSYSKFQQARSSFDLAFEQHLKAQGPVESGNAIGDMHSALRDMGSAARQFGAVCKQHQVMRKAGNLAALDKAIDKAIGLAVSKATDVLAGSLTGGIHDRAKKKVKDAATSKVKDKVSQQGVDAVEKGVEVGYDKLKDLPKTGLEGAAQSHGEDAEK